MLYFAGCSDYGCSDNQDYSSLEHMYIIIYIVICHSTKLVRQVHFSQSLHYADFSWLISTAKQLFLMCYYSIIGVNHAGDFKQNVFHASGVFIIMAIVAFLFSLEKREKIIIINMT